MPGVYDGGRQEINPVNAYYDAGGMTLRDYFAGQAMIGMAPTACRDEHGKMARTAYEMADAMLAERAKE